MATIPTDIGACPTCGSVLRATEHSAVCAACVARRRAQRTRRAKAVGIPLLVVASVVATWFGPRAYGTVGCHMHEAREGSRFVKHTRSPIDALPDHVTDDASITYVGSPAEPGTVLEISECSPSWLGTSRDGTLHIVAAR